MKEHQFSSAQSIWGWFEIGEQSDGDWLLPEQGAAANPYPLRGRVEVTLSGSSPLLDSLPPYQGG